MSDPGRTQLLIAALARLLVGSRRVAVGAQSPIPGSAAFLAQAMGLGPKQVTVLGSRAHNDFSEGGRELFDRAAQGRIDAFFLGGGQIDGAANINLVGIGDYPNGKIRFPGSFGSSYLYFLIPKVILFREEHTPRTLVEAVDFISAPGTSPTNVYRRGGPVALVTGRCVFSFDAGTGRFTLASVHPWSSPEEVRDQTGFAFHMPDDCPQTPEPDAVMRDLIAGPVRDLIAETYPAFAAGLTQG